MRNQQACWISVDNESSAFENLAKYLNFMVLIINRCKDITFKELSFSFTSTFSCLPNDLSVQDQVFEFNHPTLGFLYFIWKRFRFGGLKDWILQENSCIMKMKENPSWREKSFKNRFLCRKNQFYCLLAYLHIAC